MIPVDEGGDRERQDSPDPADDDIAAAPGPAPFDEPPEDVEPDDELQPEDLDDDPRYSADRDEGAEPPSEQHRWRRLAFVALIIATVGVGWALILGTIFIARSGDRTAELLALFESGQEQREAAFGGLQPSQEERQAALEAQQAQSQMFRAKELAALADESQSNADERLALANAALAGSRANEADSGAALAQAQAAAEAQRAEREAAGRGQGTEARRRAEAQEALTAAIEALQAAIEQRDSRGPRG